MPITVTDIIVRDIRFPTSSLLDGSDAMNTDPNYSAAYVVLSLVVLSMGLTSRFAWWVKAGTISFQSPTTP